MGRKYWNLFSKEQYLQIGTSRDSKGYLNPIEDWSRKALNRLKAEIIDYQSVVCTTTDILLFRLFVLTKSVVRINELLILIVK